MKGRGDHLGLVYLLMMSRKTVFRIRNKTVRKNSSFRVGGRRMPTRTLYFLSQDIPQVNRRRINRMARIIKSIRTITVFFRTRSSDSFLSPISGYYNVDRGLHQEGLSNMAFDLPFLCDLRIEGSTVSFKRLLQMVHLRVERTRRHYPYFPKVSL